VRFENGLWKSHSQLADCIFENEKTLSKITLLPDARSKFRNKKTSLKRKMYLQDTKIKSN
jgi:hypothetical protein